MVSVVLLDDPRDGGMLVRRVRLRDRLTSLLRRHDLDRRLADGEPPESSAALSLRARSLLHPSTAAVLARGLQHVLSDAGRGRPAGAAHARMPIRRGAVRDAAEDLDQLARRLAEPAPLGVPGLARVRLLLTDGRSPLFSARAREDLRAAIARALAGLEPA
jgi:hypothetical protein